MRIGLMVVIALLALLDLVIGVKFLFDPVATALQFNLAPAGEGPGGIAVLRADFTSFFLIGAGTMILGLIRKDKLLLTIPAILFGIPLTARTISLVVDGFYPGAIFPPMVVEAAHVAALLAAARILPQGAPGQ